jgi:hypothetical protein
MVGNSATTLACEFQTIEWRRHDSEHETTGMEKKHRAPSHRGLRGRSATNQNGQAAREKKEPMSLGAGCCQNSFGFRLREKCFSLDIPFYRTSELRL